MGAVLGTLSELGYGWAYRILDAQFFGVPQRRRRVFIVGHSGGDSRRAAEVLFECESLRGDSPPSRTPGKEVAGTLGGGAAGSRGWNNNLDTSGAFVAYAIQDGREIEKRQNGIGVGGDIAYTLDGTGAQAVAQCAELSPCSHDRELERLWVENDQRLHGAVSGNGTQIVPAVTSKWSKGSGGPAGDECQNLLAFMPEVCSTLSGGAHPGGLNGQDAATQAVAPSGAVRRLTPKECERLQGFPDNWTAGQADSHRYRQIGNAVAVPVIEWLAKRIANL